MRRKLLITLTLVSVAAAGAFAGWGDFIKGAVQATSSAPKRTGGSASVRGLAEGEGSGSEARDFKAADALDEKIPAKGDVDSFVKEGGLE